ncbi:MAG: hypothetical protein KAT23_07685, partial [Anaerolineales bacterium]|nr:hypothetical protein [Anaerolineales bacterium]
RSSDWIATEYDNQFSPSTFFKPLGTQETPGVSPAGKEMNTTIGAGAATMTFDTASQNAYWYTDLTYPTGDDDATIVAGNYTLNMYFNSLPTGGGSWYDTDWGYRKQITIDNAKVSGSSDLSYYPVLVNFHAPMGTTNLSIPVAATSDDAEEHADGTMEALGSSDLELVQEADTQIVGVRFLGVTIPPGATITNAYVQFTADNVLSSIDPCNLTVHGELNPNAATFTLTLNDISNRTTTDASVAWNPPAWITNGDALPAQATSDISTIIQEIVDQGTWASGNALAIIISGTGRREAESFDGTAAPVLHVDYVTGTDERDLDLRDTSNGGYVGQADGGDIL